VRVKPATVECDGKDYEMHLGTITDTFLGKEDHGIFTWVLTLEFGGSVQGAGTHALNDPAYLGTHIQKLLTFFGCPWDQLKNKRVYALKESHHGLVRGFMDEKQTRMVFFEDWNKEVEGEVKS
jgi:hypothetical protein